MIRGVLAAFDAIASDSDNYDIRKVDRTEVTGLIVSTAFTSDMGYETAILDVLGAHPVERYSSREDAEAGHKRWVGQATSLKTVTVLGYFDLQDDERYTLRRRD